MSGRACCGRCYCFYAGAEGEPCWGDIEVIDEAELETMDGLEWTWIHVCSGHRRSYNGDPYESQAAGTPVAPS